MEKRNKIAVFGGTFNPPHNGHVHLLNAFLQRMHFDKVLIVPTALPPHKKAADLVSGEHRLQMCRLAFPTAEICNIEIKNGGKNYTADTLEHLKNEYPDAVLYFIMGTDMFLSFGSWRDPERILKNATLLCIPRDEKTDAAALRAFASQNLHLNEAQYMVGDVLPLAVSSSEIRAKLKAGESVAQLVPPAVAAYIKQEGLYENEN